MRVLLTGAAGAIGRVVSLGLADRGHEVVGVDLLPAPDGYAGAWHSLDCTDPDAVADVVAESTPDGVVHLAGIAEERGLSESLTSHVVSTAALLEAMVAHKVGRIVYASSNHAVGNTPRGIGATGEPLPVEAQPRPDTFYGVAKVAAEGLLSLYADRFGIDAVACRIGSFRDEPSSVRHLSTWLSHDDCVRMLDAALTAPAPGYAVLYGISANTRAWWDLEPGRAFGYDPQDDAERFLAQVAESDHDEAENAIVGGTFAWESNYRPAFDRA